MLYVNQDTTKKIKFPICVGIVPFNSLNTNLASSFQLLLTMKHHNNLLVSFCNKDYNNLFDTNQVSMQALFK
jgi:hypothetical protein